MNLKKITKKNGIFRKSFMKILELNQESFSLKNIILKFDELNQNELISLQKNFIEMVV